MIDLLVFNINIIPHNQEEKDKTWKKLQERPYQAMQLIASKLNSLSKFTAASLSQPHPKTFVVVRHPFHRLVSAFRDKLEHLHRDGLFYQNLHGKKIVAKFRDQALEKFGPKFYSEKNYFGSPFNVSGTDPPELRQKRNKVGNVKKWKKIIL